MHEILAQFESLLSSGKMQEAKTLLASLLKSDLTPKEEAEMKILQMRLSIKLTNAINKAYIETLDVSIEGLKKLGAAEHTLDEKVNLAKARAALAK